MKKYLTINTDASFCHASGGAAGYAFYIVCDMFRVKKGGVFKSQPPCSMYAEIMCIGNAIGTVLAQKELPKVDVLVINTDCTNAIKQIRESNKYNDARLITIRKILLQLRKRLSHDGNVKSVEISFRHVKAHTGKNDARSWVNDWCDTEAKRWMRTNRAQLRNIKTNITHGS